MIIPPDQLAPETLKTLIEEFVTRNGAIHGHTDTPVEQLIAEVSEQLHTGRAVILFDDEDETCTIVSKEEIRLPHPRQE